ncbi:YceI family protein [Pyruvatibacter sp.]|uniref:YceI family protein n=1 Tax=Pyruvatibacter sp. TaxID=1981328 RepID=UPI0032EDD78E
MNIAVIRSVAATVTLAGALLLALPAGAAQWTINDDASTLGFETAVLGSPVSGTFGEWSADITFDETDLENATVSVTIQTATADTGDSSRDSALAGPDWFATEAHPQATLVSTAFRQTGGNTFEMDADLTIRDQTNPITLPFTLAQTDEGTKATGAVTITRTDFGVGQGDFLTGNTVSLDVTISIDIVASLTQDQSPAE